MYQHRVVAGLLAGAWRAGRCSNSNSAPEIGSLKELVSSVRLENRSKEYDAVLVAEAPIFDNH
jgi:hypothetical protein